MAGPSSTSSLPVKTVFQMSSFTWDPFNSADWDKEKAGADCILRIKRYYRVYCLYFVNYVRLFDIINLWSTGLWTCCK